MKGCLQACIVLIRAFHFLSVFSGWSSRTSSMQGRALSLFPSRSRASWRAVLMSDKPFLIFMLECMIPSTVFFHPLVINCEIIIACCKSVFVMLVNGTVQFNLLSEKSMSFYLTLIHFLPVFMGSPWRRRQLMVGQLTKTNNQSNSHSYLLPIQSGQFTT